MENTKQLTATQKRAIEIVQKLVDEGKVNFSDAFALITAIYENEKEFVYVPYQNPYYPYPSTPWTTSPNTLPWWEQNQIWCNDASKVYDDGIHTYNDANESKSNHTGGIPNWINTTSIGDFSVLSY